MVRNSGSAAAVKFEELNALSEALRQTAPWERSPRRRELLAKFDAILATPESENSLELRHFYNRQCRRAIAEIRDYAQTGVRMWKLYSSGFILKDAAGRVTAFDISDGMAPSDVRRARLELDDSVVAELADIIDVMFYTHAHLDHVGWRVAAALLQRGKKVIAPRHTVQGWLLDGAVEAETYRAPGVWSFLSQQGEGVDSVPNMVYAVTLPPGVTVLVKGDVFQEVDMKKILAALDAAQVRVDVVPISAYFKGDFPVVAELHRRFHCRFIGIHEWEFSHRNFGSAGTATQSYTDIWNYFPEAVTCAALTWGEALDLPQVQ